MSNSDTAAPARQRARGCAGPDWFLAAASMLVLISLFLPWFGVHGTGSQLNLGGIVFPHVTLTGHQTGVKAHGYLWIVFTLALLILALLVGHPSLHRQLGPGSARSQLRFRLPTSDQMLAALAGSNLVITLIGFLSKPGVPSQANLHISVFWRYGAVTALISAALAVVAAVLNLRRQWGSLDVGAGAPRGLVH